jgi:hypothetical protein
VAGSEVFVCLDAAEILSVLNRAYKIGRIELPCSACAGVYLKTNHNKLSGGLLARAAHPPVLAEAAAAAVLATVAPPPVLLAETAAAAVLAEPAFPPVCSHLPSFAVFFAGAALFFALSSAAAAVAVAFAAAFAAAAASLSPPSLSPPAPPLTVWCTPGSDR